MSFGTKPKRDHDLRKLLNALPDYLKAAIVEEVSARFPDFDKQLSNAAKAFVTCRYFYESEENVEVNILFVGVLGAAVQKHVNLEWERSEK